MQTTHREFHYTPSSVGALMDPEFLRQAVNDANEHHLSAAEPAPASVFARCRKAVQGAIHFCAQHTAGH